MSEALESSGTAPADAVQAMRAAFTFNGPVQLGSGGTIGASGGSSGMVSHRLEGVVPDAVIKDACARYAKPDGYKDALKTLRGRRVIVLCGDKETGKRTGALNLTHDLNRKLGGNRTSVMLLPDQSPADLAGRDYAENTCYLLFGWTGEESDGGDVSVGALIEKVRKHPTTHLIITSERRISTLVAHVTWQRPSLTLLMSTHGVDKLPVDGTELRDHSLPDLVRFAQDLAGGVDAATSLSNLDLAHQRRVSEWFDGEPEPREILEAAALVFLNGIAENVFESWFEKLAADAIQLLPGSEEPVTPSPFAQSRKRRENSLVETVRRAADDQDAIPGQLRRYVQLKSDGYQAHVVAELCDRYRMDFWVPVFAWLDDLIRVPDNEMFERITYGISLLAERDFDSVRGRFLQPWSSGAHGVRAWTAAAQVLSFMCWDDAGAALARRTAIRWSRSEDVLRRHAAASAFCGTVGLLFPGDAMRHLWFLSDNPETGDAASTAIIVLAARLTTIGAEAHAIVLKSLLSRLGWAVRADLVKYGRAADLALSLLRELLEEELVIVAYLQAHPGGAEFVGRLCAQIMVNRPRRSAVFAALFDILTELGDAAPLLAAIRFELPVPERRLFRTQFLAMTETRSRGETPAFVETFLKIFPEQP